MQSRWMVRVGLAALVAATLAVIPAGVNRGDSNRKLDTLSAELAEARLRRGALRADNAGIRAEIRGLRGDRRAIEERARRDLGMVYPGELVIVAPEAPSGRAGEARRSRTTTEAPSRRAGEARRSRTIAEPGR